VTEPKTPYRIEEGADLEQQRLGELAAVFDGGSTHVLERFVQPGHRCLEVGTGGGSIARWLARRVGPSGTVVATDIDLQFVGEPPPNVELLQHDITTDELSTDSFDLAHARGVLQHLDRRDEALARMVAATRPGGWVVVEDADFVTFEGPDTPEPFATVARAMNEAYAAISGHDRYLGRRMLGLLQGAGLDDVECHGRVFTMRGGQSSAEWYVRGIERAGPSLAAAGLVDEEMLASALAQARDPAFSALSPIAFAAWGRVRS
jgi:SAM-dependent methyltransferase